MLGCLSSNLAVVGKSIFFGLFSFPHSHLCLIGVVIQIGLLQMVLIVSPVPGSVLCPASANDLV
jgi:hypothetical protein